MKNTIANVPLDSVERFVDHSLLIYVKGSYNFFPLWAKYQYKLLKKNKPNVLNVLYKHLNNNYRKEEGMEVDRDAFNDLINSLGKDFKLYMKLMIKLQLMYEDTRIYSVLFTNNIKEVEMRISRLKETILKLSPSKREYILDTHLLLEYQRKLANLV